MAHLTYSELRRNRARAMDEVVESGVPLLVTRQGGRGNVVMLSAEEFDSWQETVHLLRSPSNARRLLQSVAAADRGAAEERTLAPSPAAPRPGRRARGA
ncbi:MAG: type II toxin-antitoxin system prevent-host-death family antitoxin [Acetobacteraceae bacterium]|nr:type II toxin-antitoxin system prevent-host-death family antitoxin [Acetobacteraceae bacterium]